MIDRFVLNEFSEENIHKVGVRVSKKIVAYEDEINNSIAKKIMSVNIENVFIQLKINYSGDIMAVSAGKFVEKEFSIEASIYGICPFLEGVLEALTLKEPFFLEGMVVVSESKEYNVDLELFKNQDTIDVLIHNRTNVYKYVDQLNQKRNDIFFIKREISEKNIELDRLRKIADKANEEKTRFLAMMSHEIRNSLHSILGYTEIILSEKLNPNLGENLKKLSLAGNNLKAIVNDVLDLSRIEAGKFELASDLIFLRQVMRDCENDLQHLMKNKEVKLIFELPKKLPAFILGDAVRIHQILGNLISNAIKFTKKGSIKIRLKIISEIEDEVRIVFEVVDTGRGMSEEQCLKVFEEYHQNHIDDNRICRGAGLGLAIVNRLVKAMNGQVAIKSELGVGTSFFVEIPFSKISTFKNQLKSALKNGEVTDLKHKKILVADDDLLNQKMLLHILEKENATISVVNDGLEALSKIEQETFDLILLDINMPNMTGEELMLQKKHFIAYNRNTPFVALTANTNPEDIENYFELGFQDVISKPYTIRDFLYRIKTILQS